MRKCGFGVLATDVEESEGLIVVVIVYPGTSIRKLPPLQHSCSEQAQSVVCGCDPKIVLSKVPACTASASCAGCLLGHRGDAVPANWPAADRAAPVLRRA